MTPSSGNPPVMAISESVPLYSVDLSVHHESSISYLPKQFQKPLDSLHSTRCLRDHKLAFIWRFIVFLILETSFLILSTRCLRKPIHLPSDDRSSVSIQEAKAIITAIAVVWHGLAALAVKDVTACVFSAECMAQYRLTGILEPGTTDRVSVVTSGLISQARHFVSRTSTCRHRVAFAAVAFLAALGPIGSAVLTINPVTIQYLEEIQLANLTLGGPLSPRLDFTTEGLASKRAELILSLEKSEHGTYGYKSAENQMLIPWPQSGLEYREGAIKYSTDVVTYDYNCVWSAPDNHNNTIPPDLILAKQGFFINGRRWNMLGNSVMNTFEYLPALGFGNVFPLTVSDRVTISTAAFIFFGFSGAHQSVVLDVTDLPSTKFSLLDKSGRVTEEFLASALICEPRFEKFLGEVVLEKGTLRFTRRVQGASPLGNVPQTAANAIFSQSFVAATQSDIFGLETISLHSQSLFLGPRPKYAGGPNVAWKPLSLEAINHNMNVGLQSVAKAYLGGVVTERFDGQQTRTSITQNATSETQRQSLVSSKPFLISLTVIVGTVTALCLSLLLMLQRNGDVQQFDLHTFTVREKQVDDYSEM